MDRLGPSFFAWLKIFDLILRFYFGMDLIILTQITKKNKSCVDFYFVAKKTNQVLFLPWKSKSSVILLVWMKSKDWSNFISDLFSYEFYFIITVVVYVIFFCWHQTLALKELWLFLFCWCFEKKLVGVLLLHILALLRIAYLGSIILTYVVTTFF